MSASALAALEATASGLDPERVVEVWRRAWARFVEGEVEGVAAPATTLEEAMGAAIDDKDARDAAIATLEEHGLEWSHYDDLFLVSGLLAEGAPFRVDLDDPRNEVTRAMLDAPLVAQVGGAAASFVAALRERAAALHRIPATNAKLRQLAPSLRAHLDGPDL